MPFFKTFWAALGFEPVLSEKSNKKLIHRGCEVVVSEPCFPNKVAHGHILDLIDRGVGRIFLPSVVNMPQKNAELEHSKVCPYAQGLTYTVQSAIDFGDLGVEVIQSPIYFGYGEKVLIKSLQNMVESLGVSPREAKKAAQAARKAQDAFYRRLMDRGREVLDSLGPDDTAMVVISRPYNGFDPGLNLNLSGKLRDLGVIGIPMDFLPLDQERYLTEARYHYWRYAQKILAAAEFVREDPRLYAIFITNFGCGPDSFILHFFRDLMRGKPYLEIEIDEHSSDVGAVTRLEAFLDSLKNVDVPEEVQSLLTFRGRNQVQNRRKIYIPSMTDQGLAAAAAFRACGVEAEMLPPSDDETLHLGRELTSGKECYPCILTTGDLVKLTRRPDFDPERSAFFMPTAYGPCRFGQYSRFQRLVLDELNLSHVPIYSPDQSERMYEELEMVNGDLMRLAWRGIVAVDLAQKALYQTRPYEKNPGQADRAYAECLDDICETVAQRRDLAECLSRCRQRQEAVEQIDPGTRPVVGIVGEIYVRSNEYSNENAVRNIERFGGEVWMPPIHEWMLYTNEVNFMVSRLTGKWKQLAGFKLTHHFQIKDLHELEKVYKGFLRNFHEPKIKETFEYAGPYLDPSFHGEAILSVGKSKDFILKGADGLVNIMPFTCMPGTVVTAILKRFREDHNGVPFLNMIFDGQEQTGTLTRLEAFMHQVHQFHHQKQTEKR
jgi:predicted nucleotide-binding protein (sugar kinase/HSP70/actin superfamily)